MACRSRFDVVLAGLSLAALVASGVAWAINTDDTLAWVLLATIPLWLIVIRANLRRHPQRLPMAWYETVLVGLLGIALTVAVGSLAGSWTTMSLLLSIIAIWLALLLSGIRLWRLRGSTGRAQDQSLDQ